ncbi:hypothetical protein OIV83_001877 [Microbotryomycetes sp. JL201]|nr:hypothetical protein OIV83_001877 [Microbotryomycetes sp. JL201]
MNDARWHKVVLNKRQRVHSTTTARQAPHTKTAAANGAQDDAVDTPDDVTSVGRTGAAFVPTATGRGATRIAPTEPPTRHRTQATVDQASYASIFAAQNSNYRPGTQNVNFATDAAGPATSAGTSVGSMKKQSTPAAASATKQAAAGNANSTQGGLSKTAMIGIIAGAAAAALLLFFLIGCCCWRKRKGKKDRAVHSGPGEWQPLNASVASGGPIVGMQQFSHHPNESKWSNEYKETTSLTEHDAYGGYDTSYRTNDPYANAQQPWAPVQRPPQHSSQQWQFQTHASNIPGIVLNSPDAEAPPQPLFAPQPYSSSRAGSIDSRQNDVIAFTSRQVDADQQESIMVRSPPVRNLTPITATPRAEQPIDKRDTREATDMVVDRFRQVLAGTVGQSERLRDETEVLRSSPLSDADVFALEDAEAQGHPPQSRSAFSHQGGPRQPALNYDSRVDSKPLRELEDILDSFHSADSLNGGGSIRTNSVQSASTSLRRLQLHDLTPEKTQTARTLHDISERDAARYRTVGHSPTSSISSSIPSLSHSVAATPTTPHDSPFEDAVSGDSPLASPTLSKTVPSRMSIKRKPVPPAVVVDDSSKGGSGRTSSTAFESLSSFSNDMSYRSATMSLYGFYDQDDAPELKGLPLSDARVSRHLLNTTVAIIASPSSVPKKQKMSRSKLFAGAGSTLVQRKRPAARRRATPTDDTMAASSASANSQLVHVFGVPVHLGALSLVTLTLQNSALTIVLHYSRISVPADKMYSAASAVLLNELLKGSISLSIATYNAMMATPSPLPAPTHASNHSRHLSTRSVSAPASSSNPSAHNSAAAHAAAMAQSSAAPGQAGYQPLATGDDKDEEKGAAGHHHLLHGRRAIPTWSELLTPSRIVNGLKKVKREVFSSDSWKLAIPACLYVVQNNLQFVAASNLDVPTFQNLKILTTALFSVILLRRRLSTKKWAALFFLAAGVAIVQLQSTKATGGAHKEVTHEMDRFKGLAAVAMACMTSGLAGVYFEMVLKGSKADLWVRNIQLSFFSLLPALVPVFMPNLSLFGGSSAAAPVERQPIFAHFGFWAWTVVSVQVFGGLVTALVIKYSDNIMKGFATSLAIILSFCAGVILFDFQVTTSFLVGTVVVVGATYLYNQPDARPSGAQYTPLQSVTPESSPRVHVPNVSSNPSSRVYPKHAPAESISHSAARPMFANSPPTYRRAPNPAAVALGAQTPDMLVTSSPFANGGTGLGVSVDGGEMPNGSSARTGDKTEAGTTARNTSDPTRPHVGGGPGGLHVDTRMATLGWTPQGDQFRGAGAYRRAMGEISPGEHNPLTP